MAFPTQRRTKLHIEANDEWQLQHRYRGAEAMGELIRGRLGPTGNFHHVDGRDREKRLFRSASSA